MGDFEYDYSSNVAHLFHGIVDQNAAGIYLLQNGVMQYVNEQFAEFFGTKPHRFVGRSLADIAPPMQRERLVNHYEQRVKGMQLPYFLVQTEIRNIGTRLIELHGNRVMYRGTPAVVGIAIDVTEREETHAELVESRAQLRTLMSTLENVQDAERTRIALELHDDLGGLLTALKFDIERVRRRLVRLRNEPDNAELIDELRQLNEDVKGAAQEAVSAVRRISEEIRPSSLHELGLYAALTDHVGKFETRYGICVSLELPCDGSRVEQSEEMNVFRMVQEALTNVARHAEATAVDVRLDRVLDDLVVSVEDNGRGYPLSTGRPTGLGLVGVRERARRLGGSVEIGNGSGGGARIEARVPWRFVE
ncbi:PAS domain-containing sensor histidine kinase [Nocardia salmonicida]|uniref:PAS domain-containing sensor histidine kinase n=1 Tax=Nocardia salmonicida TaxID=53431 RepID=UPI00363AE62A